MNCVCARTLTPTFDYLSGWDSLLCERIIFLNFELFTHHHLGERDHAKGRTEKISKASAAQEALNYVAEHEPEMLQPLPLPVGESLAVIF